MTRSAREATGCITLLLFVAAALVATSSPASPSTENPLEPPDRSSPRATLTTFLDSIDEAWKLRSAADPGFARPFRAARECLDLSAIPPLVLREVSAKTTLLLKEVLDRIDLPPLDETPDVTVVDDQGLTRWIIPHTEIHLVRIADGDREGQWVFSAGTVARAEEFYQRIRHLPYRPGRTGGHVEELRVGSTATLLLKLVDVMPPWFRSEIGDMMAWQWFGLASLVLLLGLAVFAVAWLGRRWNNSGLPGHRLASYILPLALLGVPLVGRFMTGRIFVLPGSPALVVRLGLSIVGYLGLAWLVAVVLTRIGELVVRIGFRDARPLKKQLVHVLFRIATIVVVTAVALKSLQLLGVPVAGLIAGLGVGGLAIALAAQGTLENFIGGIILYADRPVKVGDLCRFGDRRGTVEDVGLRSVSVRTVEQTVVTVPNADFAKMQLENLSERERILLRENICLRYDTTREQLHFILAELEAMLRNHSQIAGEPLRVRFTGFGRYYLELFAFALTSAWPEFLSIRQELLVDVMEIIDRSGTRLALPTEVHYAAREVERPGACGKPPEET